MRNPYQRKAAAKTQTASYNPQDIYKQFIETMVAQAGLIALYQDGWALCATPTGQKAFAVWKNKSLAKLIARLSSANTDLIFSLKYWYLSWCSDSLKEHPSSRYP